MVVASEESKTRETQRSSATMSRARAPLCTHTAISTANGPARQRVRAARHAARLPQQAPASYAALGLMLAASCCSSILVAWLSPVPWWPSLQRGAQHAHLV